MENQNQKFYIAKIVCKNSKIHYTNQIKIVIPCSIKWKSRLLIYLFYFIIFSFSDNKNSNQGIFILKICYTHSNNVVYAFRRIGSRNPRKTEEKINRNEMSPIYNIHSFSLLIFLSCSMKQNFFLAFFFLWLT